jgi:hypothetical protein
VLNQTEDLIRKTIERGRDRGPGQISMPAWSFREGGSLNDEQVQQLVNFIMLGTEDDWADVVAVRLHSEGTEDGHLPLEPKPPVPVVLRGAELGSALFAGNRQAACTTCHSRVEGQASLLPTAPNLVHYATEGPINDENKAKKAAGNPNWLREWVSNAPGVKPGVPMPAFSINAPGGQLSDTEIDALVLYLETLK